jgi:hypothetical protein
MNTQLPNPNVAAPFETAAPSGGRGKGEILGSWEFLLLDTNVRRMGTE